MMVRSVVKFFVMAVMCLTCRLATAEPDNYGVTHGYSVHLAGDFVNQEVVGKPTLLGDLASVFVAYSYYRREKDARLKDGQSSLDSSFDQWLPVAALVLQYTVPGYTDFIYSRTVQTVKGGEPVMYFTIYRYEF
ncbi:MAG: hypothetical protein R3F02_02355 [Thiolinea sp.]